MNPLNLKVAKVVGPLVEFAIVGADPSTLAIRVLKTANKTAVEVFFDTPKHGYIVGQEFTLDLDIEPSADNATVTAPMTPAYQVGVSQTKPAPPADPPRIVVTPPAKSPLEIAEEKLAKDAADLTSLQNAQ